MHAYDSEGSKLFSKMCTEDPYYYIWRCEKSLLEIHSPRILGMLTSQLSPGEKFNIIDLGAGDGTKTLILLKEAISENTNFEYIPIDISKESNETLCKNMENISSPMRITVLTSEFSEGIDWIKTNKS